MVIIGFGRSYECKWLINIFLDILFAVWIDVVMFSASFCKSSFKELLFMMVTSPSSAKFIIPATITFVFPSFKVSNAEDTSVMLIIALIPFFYDRKSDKLKKSWSLLRYRINLLRRILMVQCPNCIHTGGLRHPWQDPKTSGTVSR